MFHDACLKPRGFIDPTACCCIETWRIHYNTIRPGFLTPERFGSVTASGMGKDGYSETLGNFSGSSLSHDHNGGCHPGIHARSGP